MSGHLPCHQSLHCGRQYPLHRKEALVYLAQRAGITPAHLGLPLAMPWASVVAEHPANESCLIVFPLKKRADKECNRTHRASTCEPPIARLPLVAPGAKKPRSSSETHRPDQATALMEAVEPAR